MAENYGLLDEEYKRKVIKNDEVVYFLVLVYILAVGLRLLFCLSVDTNDLVPLCGRGPLRLLRVFRHQQRAQRQEQAGQAKETKMGPTEERRRPDHSEGKRRRAQLELETDICPDAGTRGVLRERQEHHETDGRPPHAEAGHVSAQRRRCWRREP